MDILPAWFVFIAAAVRLSGGASYTLAALRGDAKPNPVTWFFWALTSLIVFIAQIAAGAGWSAVMSFAFAFSPLAVFAISLKKNWSRAHFTSATITCAILASIGIVLWRITNNPTLAITFSILADIFASIPTLIKAYRTPKSEHARTYVLSMVSAVITLLATSSATFATVAFPTYMFLINLVIFSDIQLGSLASQPSRRAK